MKTKVAKNKKPVAIPAGIIEGVEAFWYNNEKWVAFDGKVLRYHDAPGRIQRMIITACLNDKKSREYMKKCGVEKLSEAFDWWYKCIVGAWDRTPDFLNGKFTADAYNHSCKDFNCIHRGEFCSLAPGLKHWEVATINALKLGFNFEKTALLLHISLPGLKSRIEKIKEKLKAKNMASLIAKAAEFGI